MISHMMSDDITYDIRRLYLKNHIKIYQTISSFYFKEDFNLIRKGINSSKTAYICLHSDFHFYAANTYAYMVNLSIRNDDVIEMIIKN